MKQRLLADLKSAMKNKEKVRKDTITMVRAAILQQEKDNKVELSDDEIIDVIAKQLKQRKDALEDFKKADRQDLIDQTNQEIEVLKDYLPEQLGDDEIRQMVVETVESTGAGKKDMGKVMKAIMPQVGARADGKTVSRIVKEVLSTVE